MTGQDQLTTVGQLPNTDAGGSASSVPAVFTRLVWLLWIGSLGALAARFVMGKSWALPGVFAIDGLTLVMWVVVTFFSGIVHSYSRRYMAGSKNMARFFAGVFAFTLIVMVLVAADHIALFAAAWLLMGLAMADLIGHAKDWPQAQAAATVARRYFIASGVLLAVALGTLWSATGETSISGIIAAIDTVPGTYWLIAAVALLLAAMIQSALVPFHTWLLSSMTAPTPASALMHAGFVNAGGVLLVRFAPVVTVDANFMLLIVVVGAVSALLGKLLKAVQSDIKGKLGGSTVGQMGFMIMQAGLGFFAAALAHLIIHGFYKAYQFLSSGGQVEQTSTKAKAKHTDRSMGVAGAIVSILTALAGGAIFAFLTGKGTSIFALLTGNGTSLDSGLLLTGLVVLMTLHATRESVQHTDLSAAVRFGLVPLVFLPAIAVYGMVYRAIKSLLVDVPTVTAAAELTVVHAIVAVAFIAAYLAIESGVYKHSKRLYVALMNATQPPTETVLTSTEEYNEY